MIIAQNILIFLLIFSLIFGMFGLFFYNNYLKKIACLATCYVNLIIILVIFSKNSQKASQLFDIITTLLILFSITLAVGAGIIFNIIKFKKDE